MPPIFPIPFGMGMNAINPSQRSRVQAHRQQRSIPGERLPDRCTLAGLVLQFRLNHYNPSRPIRGSGAMAFAATGAERIHIEALFAMGGAEVGEFHAGPDFVQ